MAALVEVANDSLGQIGEDPIAGLDDGTTKANRCNMFLLPLVDDCIRRYPWNFATFFSDVLGETDAPRFTWAHAYGLPADPYCLRVWSLNANEAHEWKVRGRVLVTDEATAQIEYSGRVTDPTLWDSIFYQAITLALASKLAASLKRDAKMQQSFYALYQTVMAEAMAADGQEGSQDSFYSLDLISVRGG